MGGDAILSTITHIIVDEVHERDRFSDFLLVSLRDALLKYKNLKLILMSATMDINIFTKYFDDCPVITGTKITLCNWKVFQSMSLISLPCFPQCLAVSMRCKNIFWRKC